MFKVVALLAVVAYAQAGVLDRPAASYATSYASSNIGSLAAGSAGHNLGYNGLQSQKRYTPAPAVASYAAPAAVVHSYAAPAVVQSHAAPAVASYAAPAAVVQTYAAPAVHTYAAPSVHTYAAPAVHTYAAPAVHTYAAPAVHTYAAPAVHTYAAPAAVRSYAVPATQHYAAPAYHRSSEAEEHGPAQYEFQYEVADAHTGDFKSQHEIRDGDVVKGQYSLHEADGTIRTVDYTADHHNGFNAVVSRSGHASHPQVAPAKAVVAAAPAYASAPIARGGYYSH